MTHQKHLQEDMLQGPNSCSSRTWTRASATLWSRSVWGKVDSVSRRLWSVHGEDPEALQARKIKVRIAGELIVFFTKFRRPREEFSALLWLIFLLRSFIQLRVARCIKNYLFHIIFFCYWSRLYGSFTTCMVTWVEMVLFISSRPIFFLLEILLQRCKSMGGHFFHTWLHRRT